MVPAVLQMDRAIAPTKMEPVEVHRPYNKAQARLLKLLVAEEQVVTPGVGDLVALVEDLGFLVCQGDLF